MFQPSSRQLEFTHVDEAVEYFFAQGWTDGLPIVPPTMEKVEAMLSYCGIASDKIVGEIPERNCIITTEKIAINAVMAGCLPSYMPVVMAAMEAVLDPAFGVHGPTASTGGAAILIIVNGPIIEEIGLNTGKNLMGTGHRANATIGRAIRLILHNAGLTRLFDQTTLGHPGKFSFCLAEAEHEAWLPLHVERGYKREESTVTVFAAESPNQVYNHVAHTPEGILLSLAERMTALATFNMQRQTQAVVVICPEHLQTLLDYKWTKEQVKQFLHTHARRTNQDLYRFGLLDVPPTEEYMIEAVPSPEDILLISGGGAAGRFSAYIPGWGSIQQTVAVTKPIVTATREVRETKVMETSISRKLYDVIIVGAGPAGMTAALYLARANFNVLVIEKAAPGGLMLSTEAIENYPGYTTVSGAELSMNMLEQSKKFGATYIQGDVDEILNTSPCKTVKIAEQAYRAKAVIMATGTQHRLLSVPGEEELLSKGVAYCALCDGAFFRGKEVAVIGGGDSAVEAALFLTRYAQQVTLIHRREQLRAQKIIQQRAFQHEKIEFIMNHVVKEIKGEEQLQSLLLENKVTGERKELPCAGVFIYIGLDPLSQCVHKLGITDEAGYILADEGMATKIPGLYAIGDVRNKEVRQVVTATGDGALAAQSVQKYIEALEVNDET